MRELSIFEAEKIRDLAQDWWLTNEELLSLSGVEVKPSEVVATVSMALGRPEALRRRVTIPEGYLEDINRLVALLREYEASTDSLVTRNGFNQFLKGRGLPELEAVFLWRTLVNFSGVNALKRRPQKFTYQELIDIVDRFLSERNAEGYTLNDFRDWCMKWHGADLSQVVRLTLGDNSWNRTKGLVFLLHKQGALEDYEDSSALAIPS